MTQTTGTLLTKERLLALYRTMLVIRRTEEQLARAHQAGLIHGACHTYVGEEAVATGVCADDAVFITSALAFCQLDMHILNPANTGARANL